MVNVNGDKLPKAQGQFTITEQSTIVEMKHDSDEVIAFNSNNTSAVSYIRSLGYHKIQQSVILQKLSNCYNFESLERIFEEYDNFRKKK